MPVWTILMAVCLAGGVFFAAVGVIGMLKFPDFFARAQASTCITTLGTIGAVVAGIIYAGVMGLEAIVFVKLVLIGLMVMVSSAVSAHALDKGTYKRGHRPKNGGFVKDDYKEDGFDEF
ncbi:MAG: monovalent cation/H(+) antiporter subunit G [Gemmiger sp.]|nr:monovalent cation/H(+) antiporter subunit G [Gemmiger sp.]